MAIEARSLSTATVLVLTPAGDRHELRMDERRHRAQPCSEIVAVQSGHSDVEKCHVRYKVLHRVQAFHSVICNAYFVVQSFEHDSEACREIAVVVDDQDAMPERPAGRGCCGMGLMRNVET